MQVVGSVRKEQLGAGTVEIYYSLRGSERKGLSERVEFLFSVTFLQKFEARSSLRTIIYFFLSETFTVFFG